MIRLSSTDYFVIFGYFVLLIALSILYRAKRFKQMFGEEKKPSWLLLSASLLMIEYSPMTDMMSMGLILDNGYSGLWLLKSRFWLAGVPAILYAGMWSRLNFKTDNELIRLRYSGKSGISLHIFRAIFLAAFVIPFLGAFIILALKKFLDVLHVDAIANVEHVLIIGIILLVMKNSFHQKIRTDFLSAIICIVAPIIICAFLLNANGGPQNIYGVLKADYSEQIRLIPSPGNAENSSLIADFLIFVFIQWWSINIVDNSDPNAQRHFQAKSQFAAFKALYIPILISSLMFLVVSTIWDCGLFEYKTSGYTGIDREAFYLQIAIKYLPDGFKAIALIAILFSFLTTLESIVNWGGGLLTVDIFKTYLFKHGSDRQYKYLSFACMFVVSMIALAFAFHNDKILNLQKFIFSISAGVAPVFLLRWFWWRINAWAQISAMLSSLVYTLIFDSLYAHHASFSGYIDYICSELAVSYYPLKIVILTGLVVGTWMTVMYCTQPDENSHLRKFVRQTGTGGWWPHSMADMQYKLKKRVFLCFVFGITSILPFLCIWQFKFGETLFGLTLLLVFVILSGYVYLSMKILLNENQYKITNI